MNIRPNRRRKPELSGHQKQIQFITRWSVILCSLLACAFVWLMNRANIFYR